MRSGSPSLRVARQLYSDASPCNAPPVQGASNDRQRIPRQRSSKGALKSVAHSASSAAPIEPKESDSLQPHFEHSPTVPNFCDRNVVLSARGTHSTGVGHNVLERLEGENKLAATASPHNHCASAWSPPRPASSAGGGTMNDRLGVGDVDSTTTIESEPTLFTDAQSWILESNTDSPALEDSLTVSSLATGETKEVKRKHSIGMASVASVARIASKGVQTITGKEKIRPGCRCRKRRTRGSLQCGVSDVRHRNKMSRSTGILSWTDECWLLSPPRRKRLMRYIVMAERTGATRRALELLAAKVDYRRMRARDLFNTVSACSDRDRRRDVVVDIARCPTDSAYQNA